ncbi:unnamed protein product [Scytosiphon promiscuus]
MLGVLLSAIFLPCTFSSPDMSGTFSSPSSSNKTFAFVSKDFPENGRYNASTACQEFRADGPTGSGWLRVDCMHVWSSWAPSLPKSVAGQREDRRFFFRISERLRRQGTPCYLDPPNSKDGAGSRSLRQLAAMVFAKEMGCDCLLPSKYRKGSDTDSSLYCHHSKYIADKDYRCAEVNWMEYFNISHHTATLPDDGGRRKSINVQPLSKLKNATERFMDKGGFDHPPWVHWILRAGSSAASQYFTMPDTWNAAKLHIVRDLLKQLRTSFGWRHPHPSSPGEDQCSFRSSQVNVAMHVRLGDRDGHQTRRGSRHDKTHIHDDYYDRLEEFMSKVTAVFTRQGEAPPVFHIFSETAEPCPSSETAAFDEFLRWPVEPTQIEPCVAAPTPDQCQEKEDGAPSCLPDRSGVFLVQGRPLYLHVGLDVENAMSCMIQADALLMGCSTFGQVAGLFSEGVKFFSIGCQGWVTAPHYKMMPPMAVAEQGSMWVPMTGSWRNPAIYSERILEVAVSQLLFEKMKPSI